MSKSLIPIPHFGMRLCIIKAYIDNQQSPNRKKGRPVSRLSPGLFSAFVITFMGTSPQKSRKSRTHELIAG